MYGGVYVYDKNLGGWIPESVYRMGRDKDVKYNDPFSFCKKLKHTTLKDFT